MVTEFKGFQTKVVTLDEEKDEVELELRIFESMDVCEVYLDGQYICSGDWSTNFQPLFTTALERCQSSGESQQ